MPMPMYVYGDGTKPHNFWPKVPEREVIDTCLALVWNDVCEDCGKKLEDCECSKRIRWCKQEVLVTQVS